MPLVKQTDSEKNLVRLKLVVNVITTRGESTKVGHNRWKMIRRH
jgi:hypothetical protein